MKSKKLLAAYGKEQEPGSAEFLIPWFEDGEVNLIGVNTGKVYSSGLVVYLGREITENDVFAKLVDAGRTIPSVDRVLAGISRYFELLQGQKVGATVSISSEPVDFSFRPSKQGSV